MHRILFTIYRIVVPKPLRTIIRRKNTRTKILKYFASLPDHAVNSEQREVLKYLESNPLVIFPHRFQDQYSAEGIEVFPDNDNGMHYVLLDGKRLYFKKRWTVRRIRKGFSDLLCEQDIRSPHRYLEGSFDVGNDDVIADIGAAEGNFSLSVIERVKKIYLFEYNRGWIKALESTFAPWKDKVEIINKRVSDFDDENNVCLDTFIREHNNISFIKIDVDGAEQKVLNCASEILGSGSPLKIALCTYHRNNDEETFSRILSSYGFTVTTSKGYMVYYYDKNMKAPYLRRGLLRAVRNPG